MPDLTPYLARRLRPVAEAEAARAARLARDWALGDPPDRSRILGAIARAEASATLKDEAARLRWLLERIGG